MAAKGIGGARRGVVSDEAIRACRDGTFVECTCGTSSRVALGLEREANSAFALFLLVFNAFVFLNPIG